jgi:hypothetical protein
LDQGWQGDGRLPALWVDVGLVTCCGAALDQTRQYQMGLSWKVTKMTGFSERAGTVHLLVTAS